MESVQRSTPQSTDLFNWLCMALLCVVVPLAFMFGVGRPNPPIPAEERDPAKLPPELRKVLDRHLEQERKAAEREDES